jgi:hypothetical protein
MEEIVQEEYFEKSYKNEFDSLFVLNYRDPIHTNISTSDYKIIEELLDELYKLELDKTERTGSYGIELWFRNEQGERMMVHIMKDGNIAIRTKTYDYIKDEENKVIKHEYTDSERKYYKITSGDLDIEDIQRIIDKIEDKSPEPLIPEYFQVSAVAYEKYLEDYKVRRKTDNNEMYQPLVDLINNLDLIEIEDVSNNSIRYKFDVYGDSLENINVNVFDNKEILVKYDLKVKDEKEDVYHYQQHTRFFHITEEGFEVNDLEEYFDVFTVRSFNEAVISKYNDKNIEKNFNNLYITKDTEGEYLEKETNNPEVIKELLEIFNKYDVIEYDGSANYGDYHIRFSNTDTLEYLEINTRKDNSLTIRTRTYVVNKDDDEKVIKHGYITSHNNYRIKNSELNVDAIDNIIDKIE